jgi:hypothetical protein
MAGLMEDGLSSGRKSIGSGLEDSAAAALFERKRPSDWLPESVRRTRPPLMPGKWRRRSADGSTA